VVVLFFVYCFYFFFSSFFFFPGFGCENFGEIEFKNKLYFEFCSTGFGGGGISLSQRENKITFSEEVLF
jgi:hypothetical protein